MTALTIAGGVYHERCIWPAWDHLYGSAGRAAAAVSGHVDTILLRSYARPDVANRFSQYANLYGFTFDPVNTDQVVSFEYIHSLSVPLIRPAPVMLPPNPPIQVSAQVVLRFGMLEGSARVDAERCVYDPQSAFRPEPFGANGSTAKRLAIVANQGETLALGGGNDPIVAAQSLVKCGAEVVVVKSGAKGAYIVDASGVSHVSAYRTDRVWTVGSGDVFAAIFAAYWGTHGIPSAQAAELASRAVAAYVESMSLPVPLPPELLQRSRPGTVAAGGKVYLAAPFFTLGQRWLVDEARRGLGELGLEVFSPVHDVGAGPAGQVAPADLAALDVCDAVFAILDGTDSGTLFEVGYARARGKPVYALAQTVSDEDLKMVQGSNCRIFDDFVTALHHTAWRT
ncbi:PfkB family carbohydrate kinase [Corallococcus carmarthensis]|uniref:PfkB family carbohydrate kinase n=1 Tax=Corallococcus carmarthensis TaxID=2316728 RepID=UPI00148E64B3|nr:PfkB family carbohydrate kinase [Corallococcus carmarthensis]NOK16005.1 nucleoside 2-deoxyribosyltransferase [Corallococcus carmarthensis]